MTIARQSRRKTGGTPVRARPFRCFSRFMAALFLFGIMICSVAADVAAVYLIRYMKQDQPIQFEEVKLGYTTILYADGPDGTPQETLRIQTGQDRIWTDYADIPSYLCDALIAVEDKRFLDHHGVDWKRTAGAFMNMIVPIYDSRQGASTLTQQVVRAVTNDKEVSVGRKIREITRALQLEHRYTKEQILEMYLNTVYFGNNAYGVQAAANTYFNKNVQELSLAESASIIGITQSPAAYDPFAHPDNNKNRQEHILKEMLEQKKISREIYEEARAQKIIFERGVMTAVESRQMYDYFTDHLIETVITDLCAQRGYSYEDAEHMVNSGGLRIYSTVDPAMQSKVTAFYSDSANFPPVANETYPQSAFVALDPNGRILALAGGIGEKTGMREFSRATQAQRQSGSSIKPLAAYPTAFERGLITWSTMIDDHPISILKNGVQTSWPSNFQGNYLGPITVDLAVRQSRNTAAVRLVNNVGTHEVFSFLTDHLGFSTLIAHKDGQAYDDENLSALALGGMTYGVTPLEMAGGYQIYANGGFYTTPYCYTKVLDSNGNVLLETTPTPRRVISAETATIMNRLLQRVTTAGTGTAARWGTMPVAGKTGTTTDDYDQWFMGVTPYMVTAAWLGYDEPARIRYNGLAYAPPVLFNRLAGQLHEGLPERDFPIWGAVVQKNYCTKTGELALDSCPQSETGWYAQNRIPDECSLHSVPESSLVSLQDLDASSESARSKSGKERPGYIQRPNGVWIKKDDYY